MDKIGVLRHLILPLCISFATLPPVQAAERGVGALAPRSQSMGQFFRFDPLPRGTDYPELGQVKLSAAHTVANQWGFDKRYIIDGQTQDDTLTIDYGFNQNWHLALGFGAKRVSPTYTDQVTIDFHNAFGIPQSMRTEVERNQTRMAIPDFGFEITEHDHGRPMTEHVFFYLGRKLWQDEHWRAGFGLFSASELGSESLAGQGARSFGGQLQISRNWQQFGVLSSWSWVKHEGVSESLYWLRSHSWSWLGAGQYSWGNWQIQTQALVHQGAMYDMGQFSRNTYEIHLGLRRHWKEFAAELTFIENVIWHYNTPDWGFALGLSYQKRQSDQAVQ